MIHKAHQSLCRDTRKISCYAGFTVCIILAKLVVVKERFLYLRKREFPGRSVVKTPHFHCREHRFDPWSGKLRSCMPHGASRGKKKKTKEKRKMMAITTAKTFV